jgi:3-hydroxybutyryl-CoA dehydrogenase
LTVTAEPVVLARCGLVVEALPEIAELKANVLSRVEDVAAEAFLASNTSSLSVDGLAAALSRPERFVGLHFFNPVPASELVEIVVGAKTAAEGQGVGRGTREDRDHRRRLAGLCLITARRGGFYTW